MRLRATGMAAELTYRTLFALIPLTVLGLVLFRIVGGLEGVQTRVEDQLFSFFGVPDVAYPQLMDTEEEPSLVGSPDLPTATSNLTDPAAAEPRLSAPPAQPGERIALEAIASDTSAQKPNGDHETTQESIEQQRVQASIRRTLKGLTEKVTSLDFASLGVIGLIVFIYAAVGLTDSVEADFNLVCESEQQRPLHLRMAIHWSILTIGSGLLAMSLYLADRFVNWVAGEGEGLVRNTLGHALAFGAGWVLLFLMYALMPNTRIQPRAAIAGSFVAALLWELAKRGFSVYVVATQPYANLYGSLGLIPLFLFWIYITWLIVLFGLFLTYSWQAYPNHLPTPEEDRQAAAIVPNSLWSISALVEIAQAFQQGTTVDLPTLTERLRLPPSLVRHLTDKLQETGYVLSTPTAGLERYTLARPAERIAIADVLTALGEAPSSSNNEGCAGWTAFQKLQSQYRTAAGNLTLAQMI